MYSQRITSNLPVQYRDQLSLKELFYQDNLKKIIELDRVSIFKPRNFENWRKLADAGAGSPQKDGPVRPLPFKIFRGRKIEG